MLVAFNGRSRHVVIPSDGPLQLEPLFAFDSTAQRMLNSNTLGIVGGVEQSVEIRLPGDRDRNRGLPSSMYGT